MGESDAAAATADDDDDDDEGQGSPVLVRSRELGGRWQPGWLVVIYFHPNHCHREEKFWSPSSIRLFFVRRVESPPRPEGPNNLF